MKILLFGKNGQVGWELQRSLAPLGELVALDRHSTELCGDLANLAGISATVRQLRPDVIVNAAAYTAVDKAEGDAELARTVNALAPGALAETAQGIGAWLVHYSSDYVFDGSGTSAWKETDTPAPLSVYGRSKVEGEGLVAGRCARHLVFRSSWVYAARGENFAKTILRLAAERDRFDVVDDQVGAPTGAELVADVTAHALRRVLQERPAEGLRYAGLYHLAAGGEVSRHTYARFVVAQAQRLGIPLKANVANIAPACSAAFRALATRPCNSRLDSTKLKSAFGLNLPVWQPGVERMLNELLMTVPQT
jgi:dTDP-4-dehydrorhamnose reductase